QNFADHAPTDDLGIGGGVGVALGGKVRHPVASVGFDNAVSNGLFLVAKRFVGDNVPHLQVGQRGLVDNNERPRRDGGPHTAGQDVLGLEASGRHQEQQQR